MPYIYSIDKRNIKINSDDIVLAIKKDFENPEFPPEYEIKIILKSGIKTVWEFNSKQERDSDYEKLKEYKK